MAGQPSSQLLKGEMMEFATWEEALDLLERNYAGDELTDEERDFLHYGCPLCKCEDESLPKSKAVEAPDETCARCLWLLFEGKGCNDDMTYFRRVCIREDPLDFVDDAEEALERIHRWQGLLKELRSK